MIFKKVRWKNLFSYGKVWTEMNLDSNLTTNIIGINGSGKSTFVEAMFIGLTGKPFRKCKKDQVVNNLNKKNCVVELEVQAGKHYFKIVRGIKPNIFTIEKDGILIDESSMMMDTQTYLEMVLVFTKGNLKHTLIMSTTDYTPFLRLTAESKRLFIEDILAIEIFSVMNKLVKAKLSILKEDIRDNETEIDKLQYKLNMILEYNIQQRQTNDDEISEQRQSIIDEKISLTKEVDSLKLRSDAAIHRERETLEDAVKSSQSTAASNIKKEKEVLEDDIKELKIQAADCKKELKKLKILSAELNSKIAGAKSKHIEIGDAKHIIYEDMVSKTEIYEMDVEKHRVNMDKGSKVRYKVNFKIDEAEEKLNYYTITDECDKCKQPVDPNFKKKQLDDIGDEIIGLKHRLEKIDVELGKLAEFKLKIDKFKLDEITPLDEKVKLLEKEMSDLKLGWYNDENELKVIDQKEIACRKQMELFKKTRDDKKAGALERIAKHEDVASTIEHLKDDAMRRIKAEEEKTIEAIDRETSNTARRIQACETKIKELQSVERGKLKDEVAPALDVSGAEARKKELAFKKLIHETTIKILSDKGIKTYIIKRYIPKLNKLVNQYLDILSASYKLQFDEELNESIALRGYDKLSYNNFSEGERQRCDIALLFAFLDIGKIKNSVTSNLLIMDEIFDRALDDDGIRGIINIVDSMKAKKFTIINISHKHQLADKFDITYQATKDQFSRLEAI